MPIHRTYGWVPDLPDHRDHLYAAAPAVLAQLPPSTDLRPQCSPVYDQGQLSSCTANAIAGAIEFDQRKQRAKAFMPSRLFIYFNERAQEGDPASDSGAAIRDGVKSIASQGVCPESEWPYDASKFADKPSDACYADAANCRAVSYQRLVSRNLNQLKGCLASGYPFVFGFTVYDAFESDAVAKTGVLNLPASTEQMQGGHAVMAVGYDDATQRFTVRNSWGPDWGMAGYFTMPYAYLVNPNLADDFWVVRLLQES
ncbi:MAG TPA: C1 family peptidase [Bryobacteraceae bacterium]|nr:C1 family peptidase [Bryobacteraceae bacterium]